MFFFSFYTISYFSKKLLFLKNSISENWKFSGVIRPKICSVQIRYSSAMNHWHGAKSDCQIRVEIICTLVISSATAAHRTHLIKASELVPSRFTTKCPLDTCEFNLCTILQLPWLPQILLCLTNNYRVLNTSLCSG